MDISDEDVRIKEIANTERNQKGKDNNTEASQEQRKARSLNSYKRKNLSRSQSVTTPKTPVSKAEMNFSYKCASKLSSLANISGNNLENWKQSMAIPKTTSFSAESLDEPLLTVASSLKSSSSVTVGFNVQEEKKE